MVDFGDYNTPSIPGILATTSDATPLWLNKGDNAWQLTAAAFVGLQSIPGLIILYGSIVKKKWAVNSAFMALYAFAAVLICWVLWAHDMSFGPEKLFPLIGKPKCSLPRSFLLEESGVLNLPWATFVFYQFVFAAITVILLAGSLLGRMNFYAWILFVPMWLTFSYTIGAYSIWSAGILKKHVIDCSGGYVIHLSSGVAGFTAAYWVGPRITHDRQSSPPNNIIHMLGGAGLLWMGWSGFNGGSPFSADLISSLAVLNTHICTATSLLTWLSMDMIVYKNSSVIGAVQGMITGLVCITPAAAVVEPWAALVMGILSGTLPYYTMMVLHKRFAFFQNVDDPLAVFHTHAVAGFLGGMCSGFFAQPDLLLLYTGTDTYGPGLMYSIKGGKLHHGLTQLGYQLLGAAFVTTWNVVVTSLICIVLRLIVNLRMHEDDLKVGDDAAHGEEAYALWGDGGNSFTSRLTMTPRIPDFCRPTLSSFCRRGSSQATSEDL
ncbi:Ammonium transporter 2 member 3 [Ranunculus cassubicifolius]